MTEAPTLRPYQEAALAKLRENMRRGVRRQCLVAPTGAGKTVIAAAMIYGAVARGKSVLFLAHRTELIEQAARRVSDWGLPVGLVKAGAPPGDRAALVQVASVQTLARRVEDPARRPWAELVIVDECHRVKGQSYLRILEHYPDAHVIGLTATPWRLDGQRLNDVFGALEVVAEPQELMEQGVLVTPRIFAPPGPDLGGVATVAGDFDAEQLGALMGRPELVGDLVSTWQRHAAGRVTVAFACTLKHSRLIVEAFTVAGVAAAHLDGTTPAGERRDTLRALHAGEIALVSNVGVLVEGWDCPPASCAILARPTKSLTLYLQACGRVLRSHPGKDAAVILDHGGCVHLHGLPHDQREWSLDGRTKRAREGGASVTTCPACSAVLPSGTAKCPECGSALNIPAAQDKEAHPPQRGGELQEVTRAPRITTGWPWLDQFRPSDDRKATDDERVACYQALKERASAMGCSPEWVKHKYRAVFGAFPDVASFEGGA